MKSMSLYLNTFCVVLSLQAGAVATSTIGLTIMVITAFYNIYAPNSMEEKYQYSQYVFLGVYLAIMMVALGMAFVSSFWAKIKLLRISAIILCIGSFLYIIISILSFIRSEDTMMYVCPGMRCPDHHWLQDARWRMFYFNKGKMKQSVTTTKPTTGMQKSLQDRTLSDPRFHSNQSRSSSHKKLSPFVHLPNMTVLANKNESGEDVLPLMLVSFIYTLLIIAFFAYTVLTFLSFEKHLKDLKEGDLIRQYGNQ